ncbi:MAG: hypothetical protein ABII13_05450 [Patescibacteria group bacterium]|nr:hypothetical protein [Patescibacteria group bacterium]MBU2508888.1 hypothetical protein [Patescibacteria group bacterium]
MLELTPRQFEPPSQEQLEKEEKPEVVAEKPGNIEILKKEALAQAEHDVVDFQNAGLSAAEKMAAKTGEVVDEGTKEELRILAKEAEVAKEKFQSEIEVGAETKEVERKNYEYHDREGRIIARAMAEYLSERIPTAYSDVEGRPAFGRELRTLILKRESGGQTIEVDLLELAKAKENGVKIVVAERRLENYLCNFDENRVDVPPLETPVDLAIFLHELGHADQIKDERFREIKTLYPLPKRSRSLDDLQKVVEAVPEAQAVGVEGGIEMLIQEEKQIKNDISRLRERIVDIEGERATAFRKSLETFAGFSSKDLDEIGRVCLQELEKLPNEEYEKKSPEVVREFVLERLKDKGFMFATEQLPKREEDITEIEHPFLAEPKKKQITDLPLVPQDSVTDWADAGKIGRNAFGGESELRYMPEAKMLILQFPVHGTMDSPTEEFRGMLEIANITEDAYRQQEDQLQVFDDRKKQLQQELEKLEHRLGELEEPIENIRALPKRMMERDATRRALQWMRALRQVSNIDLFRGIEVSRGEIPSLIKHETCEDTMKLGLIPEGEDLLVTDAKTRLQWALSSYGATTKEMRKKYGIIIPAAGSKRQSKGK